MANWSQVKLRVALAVLNTANMATLVMVLFPQLYLFPQPTPEPEANVVTFGAEDKPQASQLRPFGNRESAIALNLVPSLLTMLLHLHSARRVNDWKNRILYSETIRIVCTGIAGMFFMGQAFDNTRTPLKAGTSIAMVNVIFNTLISSFVSLVAMSAQNDFYRAARFFAPAAPAPVGGGHYMQMADLPAGPRQ